LEEKIFSLALVLAVDRMVANGVDQLGRLELALEKEIFISELMPNFRNKYKLELILIRKFKF
jgi:hypothetical protein